MIQDRLLLLRGLGLIDFEKGKHINSKGATIPVFILKQANFYLLDDFSEMLSVRESVIGEDIKQIIDGLDTQQKEEKN